MKHLNWLTLLLAGLLSVSCSQDETSTFGSISGIVKDKITAEVLAGVRVTITPGGDSSVTGTDGSFQFKDLDAADYTITYTKEGYTSDSKKVTVSPGMNRDASVNLDPIVPVLNVYPASLDFGNEVTTLAIDIKNTGKGSLRWDVSEGIDWLSCSPSSGTTTNETSSVVVTVSREGLEHGNYNGTIVVSSNGGSQSIAVSLSVEAVKIEVAPESLDFGTAETSMQLTLRNAGSGTVQYTVSSSNNWLTPSKERGSVTQTDYISAIVSRAGLSAGKYNASLTFTTDGGIIVVPVHMEVAVATAPSVSIESASNATYNSIRLRGTILSIGSAKITRHGFCWSEHESPTIEDYSSDSGDCSEPKGFESTITNLKSSTVYHVRAYAINEIGTSYSEQELVFCTAGAPTLPAVSTGTVSRITDKSARISASIDAIGNVAEITNYGHVWGNTPNPTLQTGRQTDFGRISETKSYTSDLTGLDANTTYYVRAYAVNEVGVAYGEDVMFTTQKAAPVIETLMIMNISYSSAVAAGTIINANGHTIVERGVCWNRTGSPDVHDYCIVADENFMCKMTGLDETTTYYVRAYVKTADNSVYYGNQESFTTTEAPVNPTNGLYAYYTFENNTGNLVDGASKGQTSNNPKYVEGVNNSKAMKFSVADNSNMFVPTSQGMFEYPELTISFWAKDLSDGHIFHTSRTPGGMESGNNVNGTGLYMRNGHLHFLMTGYSNYYQNNSYSEVPVFSHGSLNSGWHMITLVMTLDTPKYGYTTTKLYIDGDYIDSVSESASSGIKAYNGTKQFIIGGNLELNNLKINAVGMTVDNLRIYNSRALTDAEVMQIYEYER